MLLCKLCVYYRKCQEATVNWLKHSSAVITNADNVHTSDRSHRYCSWYLTPNPNSHASIDHAVV